VKNELSKAVNDSVIRRLAGEEAYQRGADYFAHGHVLSSEQHAESLAARVRGSKQYTVNLNVEDGILDYDCDCPAGSEGSFCKHCVAVALYWLKQVSGKAKKPRAAKRATLTEAAKILQSQEKEALIALVMDWAKDDPRFRERVLLYASKQLSPEAAVDAIRTAFDKAARHRGYLRYRQTRAYARRVAQAIEPIEQLLTDGRAAAVIDLAESALTTLLASVERTDDSDGRVREQIDKLEQIHLLACREARPDPQKLAKTLFEFEMDPRSDGFYKLVFNYADILGEEGIKAYREIAEAEWAKVPARTSKDRWIDAGSNFRIRQIMESLAELSGDSERSIEILSRDLSHPNKYLELAQAYSGAARHDDALRVAKEGMNAFPNADRGLTDFVAEEYHRRGRHDEAMRLIWDQFCGQLHLQSYIKLEQHARKANAWLEWRERALTEIRSRLARAKADSAAQKLRTSSWFRVDHSPLVEIFLYEKRFDEAWHEAQEGGCSYVLWLRLAEAREADHPEDAAPIYLKYVEPAIVLANSQYDEAVDLLVKAAAVMNRMGRREEFQAELERLRTKHRKRPNFMKLLEQRRNELYLNAQPA
jgi:uncharacterized Zn finger protein